MILKELFEKIDSYTALSNECALAERDRSEGFESSCIDDCNNCELNQKMQDAHDQIRDLFGKERGK